MPSVTREGTHNGVNPSQPCYINFTNKVLTDMEKLLSDKPELAGLKGIELTKFIFSSQESFLVHIEKANGKSDTEKFLGFNFDVSANHKLNKYFGDRTLNLFGVIKADTVLILSVRLFNRGVGQANNRKLTKNLHFFVRERSTNPLPKDLLDAVDALPVAKEQSEFVRKRLQSWEVYLDMMVEQAEKNEVLLEFHSARLTNNLRELVIRCPDIAFLENGRKLRGAQVKMIAGEDDPDRGEEVIGKVRRILKNKETIEVELDEDYVEYARQNKWNPVLTGQVHISNYGDLAQARRLRHGFKDLQNGLAQNPNLEYLLFEEEPVVDTSKNSYEDFRFTEAIEKSLNKYQYNAVKGALAADDLYLIQGPPGTGKTTVIAEICYQNAERGLKTLVASQSNLAVDNALSKLLSHPKIRILRKGRTNSIEEEGKKFIEENVADTWKAQTKESVEKDIAEMQVEMKNNHSEIAAKEKQLKLNTERVGLFNRKPHIQAEITRLKKALQDSDHQAMDIIYELNRLEEQESNLRQSVKEGQLEIKKALKALENWEVMSPWRTRKKELEDKVNKANLQLAFSEIVNKREIACAEQTVIKRKMERLKRTCEEIETVYETDMDDFNALNSFLTSNTSWLPKEILQRRDVLLQCMRDEQEDLATVAANFEKLEEQLHMVISKQEEILRRNSYDTELAKQFAGKHSTIPYETLKDIVSELGRSLIAYTEPNFVDKISSFFTKRHPQKLEKLIKDYTKSLQLQKLVSSELTVHRQRLENFVTEKSELPSFTEKFGKDVLVYCKEKLKKVSREMKELELELHSQDSNVLQLDQLINEQKAKHPFLKKEKKISSLAEKLKAAQKMLDELGSEETYREIFTSSLQLKKQETAEAQKDLSNLPVEKKDLEAKSEKIAFSKKELEEELKEQNSLMSYFESINILKEKQYITQQNRELNFDIRSLKKATETTSQQLELKREWFRMLEEAKEYDLKEIKNLYIKHANVIGITCVQSAKKDFAEEYPDFDAVIIDEVSKATPPELLLPMLKGKKVILVGDHHQLPPLIGQETLEEVVESIREEEKKQEVKDYLKESLFERLFKTMPEEYKTTLRIQYRMHEDIMDTITQFYKDSNSSDGYGLSCGLVNSNKERDHQLEGNYVRRGQHIMWFDLPHEKDFFEEQEQGMTSRYNSSELKIILELLKDLNYAVDTAKREGRFEGQKQKKVGIISFYGEQVRRLKHMIDDHMEEFPHLVFRIGTVDRFQGMESDVIITSFVRNHNNKEDDIGFSKDYRRLNVALSRAKELLIITGSSRMFTKQTRHAGSRRMYSNVVETIRQKNGLRDHMGRMK
jgi:superfamily I DNA and/or RNA helicase